ncbi:hypothetical protein [Streptosporangium sp. CA-115845]|uniref:hypothetical protein n=1 Tax=Streptosporangium sp. CA-115845 TaxID=3240071 RepID=UPI003D8E94AD
MKLRADPIHRLSLTLMGIALIAMALEGTRIRLGIDIPFRLEDFRQAPPAGLLDCAVFGIPALLLGGLLTARAPLIGVTCTDEFIRVRGCFRTRTIPTSGVTGLRRGRLGGLELHWEDRRGWPRWTRIGAFSVSFLGGKTRDWVTPHNARCADALEKWIDQQSQHGDRH